MDRLKRLSMFHDSPKNLRRASNITDLAHQAACFRVWKQAVFRYSWLLCNIKRQNGVGFAGV